MRRATRRPGRGPAGMAACLLAVVLAPSAPALASDTAEPVPVPAIAPVVEPAAAPALPPGPPPHLRSGAEIYAAFREGLAEPECPAGSASPRWSSHFAAAARRLAGQDETLAMFGYVVDALREAHLPTEYALIPFVESGYRPDAQSKLGPAGLWQFIRMTARNHKVPIRPGFDGRLSPVESTRAAVRYLKTLHGMFAGDWRLAAMAYNAGEYRLLAALRKSGQVARNADHDKLPGLSGITRAYPRKMHAISCLLQQADDRAEWLASVDRPVERLVEVPLPQDAHSLDAWAREQGLDPARVRKLNPAFANGRIVRHGSEPLQALAPAVPAVRAVETVTIADAEGATVIEAPPARTVLD